LETLVNEWKEAGTHTVLFDTKNLPTGTYLVQARTKRFSRISKIQIFK